MRRPLHPDSAPPDERSSRPNVALDFRPASVAGRVRFLLAGRPLFWWTLRGVARLPPDLTPRLRERVQGELGGRLLRHLRVRLDRAGFEHVGAGPYLVVALHEGMLDVLALLQLPLPLRFVARREIFSWPGVGAAITRLGHISIDPESGAAGYRAMMRAGRDVVAGGESLVVFPQGSVLGLETQFQRGAFVLARQLDLPILPVVLTGAHRVWEHPFTPTLRYGQRVGLRVLPPVRREEVRQTPPEVLRVRLRRAMKRAALDPAMPPARRYDPARDGFWDGYRFDIDPDFSELCRRVLAHRRQALGETA